MSNEKNGYKYRRAITAALEPGSPADKIYREASKSAAALRKGTAKAGLNINDLVRRGGRIIARSQFRNIFLGPAALWNGDDERIDRATGEALRDRRLENVLRQYFAVPISCDQGPAIHGERPTQTIFTEADAEALITTMFKAAAIPDQDLDDTIFNIVLPRDIILSDSSEPGHSDHSKLGQASSLTGLGGFHGSVNVKKGAASKRLYYSVNVFSARNDEGRRNGIIAFAEPWKNVVATLYHEINEFRTDPDVAEANRATSNEEAEGLLGWLSTNPEGNEEIGDNPLSSGKALGDVFREILLSDDVRKVPVQFLYSNAVHDAQGPVETAAHATRRRGHGVGLRGLETAKFNPSQARFGKMFDLPPRGDVAPFPEDLGLPGGPMDGGLTHANNPNLPAVLTYFGQFLDHDITFDPTSSLERQNDLEALVNFRTPALELDNVYGAGPAGSAFFYDQTKPHKLLLGPASNDPAEVDLPRNAQKVALIGDPRNDENLIVSQLHVAFLKFHNAIVDQLDSLHDAIVDDGEPFDKAQRLVRWHYQWLVLHEFLPKIVGGDTVADIVANGTKLYKPTGIPFIPVEFSVAAYRFGHSMVQPGYAINDNFGAILFPDDPNAPPPTPGQRRRDLRGGPIRFDERVNWKNFVDTGFPISPGANSTRQSSMIDTKISRSLLNLPTSVVPASVPPAMRSLAVRNLRRGVVLELPSGQAVAKQVQGALGGGVPRVLTEAELWGGTKFEGKPAPLWYYLLKEAEVLGQGLQLGPIGGRIVAEVIIGLLTADKKSFLARDPSWRPIVNGRKDPGAFTFADLFTIAGTDVS